jgi:hypothetical protein
VEVASFSPQAVDSIVVMKAYLRMSAWRMDHYCGKENFKNYE